MTPPAVVPVRKFVADAGERVLWTFVETFAGALAVTAVTGSLSLSAAHAAMIAAAAATLTVVKALAASRLGTAGTAATLPAGLTPTGPPPPPIIVTASTSASNVAGIEQTVRDRLPSSPVTEPTPMPTQVAPRPPVEALRHVDPPTVPPAPSRTALGARAERDKAAAEARAAKTPAKKATPAKRPTKKASSSTASASAARGKAAAKKASGARKRSR